MKDGGEIMTFSELCDWIVLIGAVSIAIKNIYKFVSEPYGQAKSKKEAEVKQQIETTLDEKMPDILLKHDLETRKKYLADRQNYLCEIKTEVLNDTKDTLEGILKINMEQNKYIEVLTQASKDVLRQRIMNIYHKYKGERRMPIYAREALDELYKDYKSEGGNSYIDKYYKRMCTWETYEDDDGYID